MSLTSNNYDFAKQLKAALVETQQDAYEVVADTALEIMRDTVMETPVDSGQLRSNWRMGEDEVDDTTDSSHTDEEGLSDAEGLIKEIKKERKEFDFLAISNNLPYAQIVEYGEYKIPEDGETEKTINGYSKQAPTGMFRRNLRRFDTIAAKHAKRIMRRSKRRRR